MSALTSAANQSHMALGSTPCTRSTVLPRQDRRPRFDQTPARERSGVDTQPLPISASSVVAGWASPPRPPGGRGKGEYLGEDRGVTTLCPAVPGCRRAVGRGGVGDRDHLLRCPHYSTLRGAPGKRISNEEAGFHQRPAPGWWPTMLFATPDVRPGCPRRRCGGGGGGALSAPQLLSVAVPTPVGRPAYRRRRRSSPAHILPLGATAFCAGHPAGAVHSAPAFRRPR